MTPRHPFIEIAVAALAVLALLYALTCRTTRRPHRAHTLARYVLLEGCYEFATAPPFSGDLRDWICVV